MLAKLSILVCTLILATACIAEGVPPCYNKVDWETSQYSHKSRGEVILYKVPTNYDISPTNLACITVLALIELRKNVPNSMVVGLITEDFRQAFIVKWSIADNMFVLLEVYIPENQISSQSKFTVYPNPLKRIRELMVVSRFPTPDELPPQFKKKFKTNYMVTSVSHMKSLFNPDEIY